MAEQPRILFYVLHLLGVGHIHRAARIVRALVAQGCHVDVVHGGMPVSGFDYGAQAIHHLPPLRAGDATYATTLDDQGEPVTAAYLDRRQRELLRLFDELRPDAILTEAFPFGRRVVRGEILALIEAARQRDPVPLIVSSVRDILQENRKPGRIEEATDWAERLFDRVLVHADPSLVRLNDTFPMADRIAGRIAYTGFVVPQIDWSQPVERQDIIVSAGGGAFGFELMQVAMDAARRDPHRTWRLTTGPSLPERLRRMLAEDLPENVVLHERLDGLAAHMAASTVTVSQCGYNTAMDALAARQRSGCGIVFVPHDTTGQTEQIRRAALLQEANCAISVPQSQLTARALLTAMDSATLLPPMTNRIDFDGAANSARLLRSWIAERA